MLRLMDVGGVEIDTPTDSESTGVLPYG